VEDGWKGWKDPWTIRNVSGSLYPARVAFTCSSPGAAAETVFRAGLPCLLTLNAVIILQLFSPLHFKPEVVSFVSEHLMMVVIELSGDTQGFFQRGYR